MGKTPLRLLLVLAAAPIVLSLASTACSLDGDDGGPKVTTVAGESPEAEPDPEADPEAQPQPGVVQPKPAGASEVRVTLQEWQIDVDTPAVAASALYFLVDNLGPDDAHEFVVVRSDAAPDALPVVDGRVPEDEVDLVDEIEPFAASSSASVTLELEPGSYVFLCNIAEVEDGEMESHYQLGMRTGFTVQ